MKNKLILTTLVCLLLTSLTSTLCAQLQVHTESQDSMLDSVVDLGGEFPSDLFEGQAVQEEYFDSFSGEFFAAEIVGFSDGIVIVDISNATDGTVAFAVLDAETEEIIFWEQHETFSISLSSSSLASRSSNPLIRVLLKIASKAGKLFKRAPKPKIDPNKLNHIFGKAAHNLDDVVKHFGSQEKAFNAIQKATETVVKNKGLQGVFETTVTVGGKSVTVRGNVIDGAVKIGTAFK